MFAVAGCGPLFEKPSVSVKRVDVTSINFGGIGFEIVFDVVNPNVIGLDLAKLTYQLKVDNHQFVAGAINRPLHVPPQGTGELHVPVAFRFVELAEALVSLFEKPVLPYSIAVTLGFASPVGVIGIPISHAGTFPVPRIPDVAISRAAVGNVSASGAEVSLGLKLHNGNAFAVPLSNLSYRILVENAPVATAATGPISLGPNARLELPITARADFLQAGLGILRALESRSASIALDGTLDLGGFTIPVHVGTRLQ